MDRQGWNDRYRSEELLFTADPARFLAAEVQDMKPGRALDLGSGEGRNVLWLAQHGWTVTGVDFSEVGVGKAHRLARSRGLRVDWVVADLRSFCPPLSTFDFILQFFVHLGTAQRRTLLRRAAAALRPGGVILVVGYDVSHLDHGASGGPRDPDRLYTVDGLRGDLAGLVVERAERRPVPVDPGVGPAGRFAVDVVVRARKTGAGVPHDRVVDSTSWL